MESVACDCSICIASSNINSTIHRNNWRNFRYRTDKSLLNGKKRPNVKELVKEVRKQQETDELDQIYKQNTE
jgi:hypothetical protein